ncbi:MAG: methionyl-tRNA formyltransferase [Candidatus Cloacimonetes bacterium HGW-Cloacimonetes-1]|jgi:methionyl-tRNA formyltransferase|nr:MAG: methionyl-tRNA formyltransferase [Candidatus Cloacimonetes bacterium HGW-Cloacimonetes-1]
MKQLSLVFIGTSEYAVPALKALVDSKDYCPQIVISQPDRPKGRKLQFAASPISELAQLSGLKLLKPETINCEEVHRAVQELKPDLIVTASYGGMIGRAIRKVAKLGAVNLHPSLLPKYRGASPIQSALMNGETATGITIFGLNAKMDAGKIHKQMRVGIDPNDNYSTLQERLAELSAQLLLDYLADLQAHAIQPLAQVDQDATYTAKIEKEDQLICWNQDATRIRNKIRALTFSPGAYQYFRDLQIKIISTSVLDEPANGVPGTIADIIKNIGFTINTKDQQLLIQELQPAGKKVMTAWAYHIGARVNIGEPFERLL